LIQLYRAHAGAVLLPHAQAPTYTALPTPQHLCPAWLMCFMAFISVLWGASAKGQWLITATSSLSIIYLLRLLISINLKNVSLPKNFACDCSLSVMRIDLIYKFNAHFCLPCKSS
jgi:hypothetical protein